MEANDIKTAELQQSIGELKSLLSEMQAHQESLIQELKGFRAEYKMLIDFLIDQNVKQSDCPIN